MYCYASFAIAVLMMAAGVFAVEGDLGVKAFFGMGTVFLISSTFNLSKMLRDRYEGTKLVNRIDEAKTERLLKDFDPAE